MRRHARRHRCAAQTARATHEIKAGDVAEMTMGTNRRPMSTSAAKPTDITSAQFSAGFRSRPDADTRQQRLQGLHRGNAARSANTGAGEKVKMEIDTEVDSEFPAQARGARYSQVEKRRKSSGQSRLLQGPAAKSDDPGRVRREIPRAGDRWSPTTGQQPRNPQSRIRPGAAEKLVGAGLPAVEVLIDAAMDWRFSGWRRG